MDLHDWSCVLHVHSTYSDGTATVPEIAAAAAAAGADAVLLTDHDTLAARRDGHERWHGDVLVLVGHEVSPRGGHYLAFGLEDEIPHDGLDETQICRAVQDAGGFGFAAHPFSEGSRMSTLIGRPHPWPALEEGGCGTGIELWSLATDSAEAWRSPREAVRFLRDPEAALYGPPERHMREWDRLCRERRVVAVGGLDAHQTGFRIGARVLSPMRHERWFGYLRTHVLTERPPSREPAADREQIYAALRAGRCYLSLSALAPATGTDFRAERDDAVLPMGAQAPAGDWVLRARLPEPADLRLLRDGELVARTHGRELEHRTGGPGAYRLEAWLERAGRARTWVITNPIYLRP